MTTRRAICSGPQSKAPILQLRHDVLFSSRRRHTRSYGDWSSDVCSSDLTVISMIGTFSEIQRLREQGGDIATQSGAIGRSEERRVGKEGRSRGAQYPVKEKCTNIVIFVTYIDTTIRHHSPPYMLCPYTLA